MTHSHKLRGTGALTGHGRRRGWGSVGRVDEARARPTTRPAARHVLRPAHELRPEARRRPSRVHGAVLLSALVSLILVALARLVGPLRLAGA